MKDLSKVAAFVLLASALLAIGGVLVMPSEAERDYGDTVTVATSPYFPPYDTVVGNDYAGIELDIVKAIAKELDVNIQMIPVDFDSILAGVASGNYMVGASGFTIKEERKQSVDFSDPYTPEVKQVLLVKKDSTITGVESLKNMVITSQSGTTGYYYAADCLNKDGNTIVPYETYAFSVQMVLSGKADALVVEDLVAKSFVKAHSKDLRIIEINDTPVELYGFIFKKGGSQLETDWNNALIKLMGDGTVDAIYEYYAKNDYLPETPSYYQQEEKTYGDTITVASSPDFPPYDTYVGSEYAGIELDIVKAIAKEMDVTIEFVTIDFDSILAGVSSGNFMVGASGFTINDERKKSVDFSDPYTPEVKQVLLVKADSDIYSVKDLKNKVITSQSGTTGCYYADDYLNKDGNTISPLQTYSFCVQNILLGKADALVVDDLVATSFYMAHKEDLRVVAIDDTPVELYGFIFKKGGSQLETDWNNALNKLMKDGTVDAIYAYYATHNYEPSTSSYYTDKSYGRVISVASSPDFPPYDTTVGDDYAGIELDIVRAIAKVMNVDINIIPVDFDSIIAGVSSGTYMVGASGFTINEERKLAIDFSTAYTPEVKQVLLVLKDSDINGLSDLKNKVITAQSGTTGYYYAADYLDKDGNTISPMQTYSFSVQMVLSGKADALVVDDLVATSFLKAHQEDLRVVEINDTPVELYGFIFKKGGSELENDWNAALELLLADGTIQKIYDYYGEHDYDPSTPSYFSEGGGGGDEPQSGGSWLDDLINSFIKSFITKERYKTILSGLVNTIIITVVALAIGLAIGALVATVRNLNDTQGKLRVINWICKLYVTVIRGTPVMVQLLIIYFIVFASSNINAVLIASLAFGLNSGAYVSEIIRAGINSVPKGQMEACRSLGMPYKMSMFTVIMPQAIKNILPALCNEGISLLKETSIAGYIGVVDLTFAAKLIVGQTYEPFMPYVTVALIYLAIVLVLQYFVGRLEKRLNKGY